MRLDRIKETALVPEECLTEEFTFYNDVLQSLLGFYVNKGGEARYIEEKDPTHSYTHNSWGCRDKEFTGPVDIIAAGCSMTYGQGVPLEYRWSELVSKNLDATTSTLAVPGWSTQSIVNAIMNYITKFGKPKAIAIWLPDFFRIDLVTNEKLLVIDKKKANDIESGEVIRLVNTAIGHINETPKVSKKPHVVGEVLNSETTALLAGQSLRFLIEYCKEADIELVYSTWDLGAHELIEYIKHLNSKQHLSNEFLPYDPRVDLSGYVDAGYRLETNEELALENCHLELKDNISYCFDWGTDEDGHVGAHMHAHVAEKFIDRLKSVF